MSNRVKVYSVEFMSYTNCMKDTVSDWDGVSTDLKDMSYLDVKGGPFLVTEPDLTKYSKYGQGYRTIQFVGWMNIDTFTKPNDITIDDVLGMQISADDWSKLFMKHAKESSEISEISSTSDISTIVYNDPYATISTYPTNTTGKDEK